VVVITGASSGLGWELAVQLSQYRPKLVVAARNAAKLDELKALCLKKGAKEVLTVVTDVSKRESCQNLVNKTREKFQAIDVLFLNAGVSQASFASVTSPDVFDQVRNIKALLKSDHENKLQWCRGHCSICH
jgi:NADP-dependent 3-hydroxy acid dehydrogenase YdfG